MAKASIKIICEDCGHEFTHSKICYNRSQSEDYEQWAKENITQCPACYRKMLEEIEARKQEAKLEGIELVALEGSEKQVALATKIRRIAMAMCAERHPNDDFWKKVNEKADAKWWIDKRDDMYTIKHVCKALLEEE